MATLRKFGWKPDIKDKRDLLLSVPQHPGAFPSSFAQPTNFIFDQGGLGSCTANAVGGCFETIEIIETTKIITPSRLALYYYTRKDEGSADYDSGATIRDTIKAAARHGICRDAIWPYIEANFAIEPNKEARTESWAHHLDELAYARVPQSLSAIKATLMAKSPIAFGFPVYSSFMDSAMAKTGRMQMPNFGKERVEGGHATKIIGWDDNAYGDGHGCALIKNSWGTDWGMGGLFWMPYDFLLDADLASDFWAIFKVKPLGLQATPAHELAKAA